MKRILKDVSFMQGDTMCFGDLHIENGFIERIEYKTPKPLANIAIHGFIDMHTHGFRGYRTQTTDANELRELAIAYAKRGTVGFVATIDPVSFEECKDIFQAYREAFQGEYLGARFYGIHMEGPYFNTLEGNDLDPTTLKSIDVLELENFLHQHSDILRIMSIAPELEHGEEAIAMLHRFGILVSLAHTRATYEQTISAIKHGVSQCTHICNAMEDINHRRSGVMDAILLSNIKCEVNLDGVHIQKPMLKWLLPLLGSDRVMAISDGSSFSGFEYPDGYQLDEHHIVKGSAVYSRGYLSGSFRDLLDAFQYLYKDEQYSLIDCMKMTSINASKQLTTMHYEINLGKKVNLVVLDHNAEILEVYIEGKKSL